MHVKTITRTSAPAKSASNFSAIFGILSFGITSFVSSSNRLAILLTLCYFVVGLIVLLFVNERRGREAALSYRDESGG